MAVSADLLFGSPPPANADLLFGAAEPGSGGAAATLKIALPELGMVARVAHVHAATARMGLPALGMVCTATWDTRTDRPLASRVIAPHQQAAAAPSPAVRAAHHDAVSISTSTAIPHQDAAPAGHTTTARHSDAGQVRAAVAPRHQDGRPVRTQRAAAHQDAARLRRQSLARHDDATGLRTHRATRHQDALRQRRSIATHTQPALPTGRWHGDTVGPALPSGRWIGSDHQDAVRPPIGRYALPPIEPPEPPPLVSPHLLFCQPFPTNADLLFGWVCDTGSTVVIPIREVYLVINTFSLVRADNAQPVEVTDFSANIDADSWTWGWSASLHADLMPLVRSPALGEHVELIATLNGTPLRLVVERLGRDRRFADARLKISGRGRAAWLSDPHSPIATRYNTETRTAQQLLGDALTINNVSIGWSIDWRITDWLVPAGAWSNTGTYMDAATRIAEAGGAYVQAHNTDQTLIVLPRYPVAPWNWGTATPDIELPEDVCEVEGIEWQDKPSYNAVWVSGGEGGRRDRIRRAGQAADRPAPTVVDDLATAPEMTLQRGTAVLGDTGRQAHITLRLPVLPETGIIQPGKLVRYTEGSSIHIGLSRSVQVEQRFPALWQTVRLETHESV